MKDYVGYHPPVQSKQGNQSKPAVSSLNYRVLIPVVVVLLVAFAIALLSYKGYQELTQINLSTSQPQTLSSPEAGQNNAKVSIAKFQRDDNDWWYEKLLTEPVQLDSNEQQAISTSSNIPSKLRCGTFNTVERAQRLQQQINSLDLHKQALVTQTNNKFVVWVPNLVSRRLAEKLRHKVLDANIGRCVIYDA